MALQHQEIPLIPNNEPVAVPSLWNVRYQKINENFTGLDERAVAVEEEIGNARAGKPSLSETITDIVSQVDNVVNQIGGSGGGLTLSLPEMQDKIEDVAGLAESAPLTDAEIIVGEGEESLTLRLTVIDAASGETTTVGRVFPVASALKPGLMSPADVAALTGLITAVESLSGRGGRYPVNLSGIEEINQEVLQTAYEDASGEPGAPADGATLIDLDSNTTYIWYASTSTWEERGSDTVSVASNTLLGVVKGDPEETPGKVYVETDGSMSVLGWDALSGKVNYSEEALTSPHTWTTAQRGAITTLASAATITPDFVLSNNFELTLAQNATLANPINVVAGQSGVIVVTQDTTGSRTLAYGSYYKFAGGTAPTLTTAANAIDMLAYYVKSPTHITVTSVGNVK